MAIPPLIVGLFWGGLVAGLGYLFRALNGPGAGAAVIMGTVVFAAGGWAWSLILVAFFASSSLLSSYRKRDKAGAVSTFAKGGRRDLAQVLANGGVPALAALGFLLNGNPLFLAAYVGALAAVNADTWGTEIGLLSRHPPRLITTMKPTEPGASGGVTVIGSLASLAGGAFIGLTASTVLFVWSPEQSVWGSPWRLIPLAVLAGSAGSLVDSVLGATLQAGYYCERCARRTERRIHTCGSRTSLNHGIGWFSNDVVNLAGSLAGVLAAVILMPVL